MIIDFYRMILGENLSPAMFFFIIGLIVAESYFLIRLKRQNKLNNAVAVGITLVSLMFSMSLVARPNDVTEKYEEWYSPKYNGNGCMAEAFRIEDPSGDFFLNTITFNHYFEGKDAIICEDISSKDEIALYLDAFSSARSIAFSNQYLSTINEEAIAEAENGVNIIEKDSRKYILDKTWKNAERIVGTSIIRSGEETVYFMSEELFNDLLNNDYQKDLLSKKDKKLSATEYMNKQRGETTLNHKILLLIFFIIGFIPCTILFKGKMGALCACMSFPAGLSITALIGFLLIIFGIPYKRSILLGLCMAVFGAELFFAIKNKAYFKLKTTLQSLCVAIAVDIVVVELKVFKFCTDSANKMWCAYILAEGKADKGDLLGACLPWGMLEPIVHAIGWKFKTDIVYGIYIGTFICSIGIIVSAAYYLAKKENKTEVVALALVCAGIYASNNDAFIIGIWAHGNGPTGCMILAMLVAVYVTIEKNLPTKWIATLFGFSIIITRVEGGIYVCLLLLLLCGLKKNKEFFVFNLVVTAELLLFQIVNLLIAAGHVSEENEEFWEPEKAMILIALGMFTIVITLLFSRDIRVVNIFRPNFYKIAIIVCILASLGMFVLKADTAYPTLAVFLRHFATAKKSNSEVLWGFAFMMLPLLLTCQKKKTRFLVAFVLDYILLQFLIYCVRDASDPIHVLIGDSCRRTLQQILSTVMVIVPLIWNEIFDGKKKVIE